MYFKLKWRADKGFMEETPSIGSAINKEIHFSFFLATPLPLRTYLLPV